jgi:hypothetical protein
MVCLLSFAAFCSFRADRGFAYFEKWDAALRRSTTNGELVAISSACVNASPCSAPWRAKWVAPWLGGLGAPIVRLLQIALVNIAEIVSNLARSR